MRGLIVLLALVSGCQPAPAPADPPARAGRIVSINPCVDAILMRVADPSQIAGISHYSQDVQASSIPLAQARRFKATSGTAEEVIALAPDLVVSGSHVDPATIAALRKMRIPLIQLEVADSIAQSNAQIRAIAAATGHPERGDALVAAIMGAVDQARSHAGTGAPVPALIWQGGGLVPGSGTLADELLTISGFRNMSAAYGLESWDVLPLEYLLARPPRVLLSTSAPDQADRMLGHPALKAVRPAMRTRAYPPRLMNCAGPTIVDALARLSAIRAQL